MIECFQGTLDDINGDLIGDSAGDVGVVKMLSSSVPAIPAGAFQNFPSLAALTITGSGLSDIEQDSFTGK